MLWSAGLQQLRRLPFTWLALHCCLFLIRFNLCSKHNDGVGETDDDCAAMLLLLAALMASSICFKSCFFTTIFTLIPPSDSSVFETTLPLLILATDSKKLLLVVLWFRVLDVLYSLLGEPSATLKYSMISLSL